VTALLVVIEVGVTAVGEWVVIAVVVIVVGAFSADGGSGWCVSSG